jgi:hypothetical protein
MVDELFINTILERGAQAKSKATRAFHDITVEQFNWKPSSSSWSIAQCLDHLMESHRAYSEDLHRIGAGTYRMTWWEKNSPLTSIWGRELKQRLQEEVKMKMIAPRVIQPSSSRLPLNHLMLYHESLDEFLEHISKCRVIDIDKTIINSPTVKIVTYSLRDAFQFLLQHEHRHLNQAIRVKQSGGFSLT